MNCIYHVHACYHDNQGAINLTCIVGSGLNNFLSALKASDSIGSSAWQLSKVLVDNQVKESLLQGLLQWFLIDNQAIYTVHACMHGTDWIT